MIRYPEHLLSNFILLFRSTCVLSTSTTNYFFLHCRVWLFWILICQKTTLTVSKIEQKRKDTALIMPLDLNAPIWYTSICFLIWFHCFHVFFIILWVKLHSCLINSTVFFGWHRCRVCHVFVGYSWWILRPKIFI